jgi:hypothetical protein
LKTHKEKEMVDFRKWFPALAIVALLLGSAVTASAQPAFTCNVTAGVPPLVRSEGITELVGDIVLNCTGGIPTTGTVPGVNVTVFLNTNITSRLLDSNNLSEAMLMIDEPGTPSILGSNRQQIVCIPPSGQVSCPITNGIGNSGSVVNGTAFPGGIPYGTVAAPGGVGTATAFPNIFLGRWGGSGSPNTVTWAGVPIDPPGTVGTRVIRITNLRANASQLGVSSTLVPSQIVAFVSITSTQPLALANPQQIIGFVTRGLDFSVQNPGDFGTGRTLLQCNNNNSSIASSPTNQVGTQGVTLRGRFREGFASSFKRRGTPPGDYLAAVDGTYNAGSAVLRNGGTYSADNLPSYSAAAVTTPQAVPGQNVFTESGFYIDGLATAGGSNGTNSALLATPSFVNGAGSAGLADHGTRLMLRLTGIPTGAQIFAAPYELGTTAANSRVRLISTDASGAGGATLINSTTTSRTINGAVITGAPVTVTGGAATIVYEVVTSDPQIVEQIDIPVIVAFAASAPGLGTANVIGSFAPISNVTTASSSAPIPRFADVTSSTGAFTINPCRTNLLFPFVTNQAGFDTGVAISNTSLDIYSASADQSGPCRVHYFGSTTGGGPAPATQTTSAAIPAGGQLTFVLSTGGTSGFVGTPGFQGYIIAQCDFQYGHGFAFITDGPIGAARVAEGYLAIVLDDNVSPSRTETVSESKGH